MAEAFELDPTQLTGTTLPLDAVLDLTTLDEISFQLDAMNEPQRQVFEIALKDPGVDKRGHRQLFLSMFTGAVVISGALSLFGKTETAHAADPCEPLGVQIGVDPVTGLPVCTVIIHGIPNPGTGGNPKPKPKPVPTTATNPDKLAFSNADGDILQSVVIVGPDGNVKTVVLDAITNDQSAGTCTVDRNGDLAGPTQTAYDAFKNDLKSLEPFGLVLTTEDWCVIESEGISKYTNQITAAEQARDKSLETTTTATNVATTITIQKATTTPTTTIEVDTSNRAINSRNSNKNWLWLILATGGTALGTVGYIKRPRRHSALKA